MSPIDAVEETFKKIFHEEPLLFRSPGRVNLIGEHTDYNDGYVLPAAIHRAIYFAIAPDDGPECRLIALDMNEEHRFPVDHSAYSKKGWPNYLMGVVDQFTKAGHRIPGFHCVFGGDVPIGAGMSSSAAIEAGLAVALNSLFHLGMDDLSLVKLAQRAENEFVGVRCGIMDQYINVFGKQDTVLQIDCRSLESRHYPFEYDVALVLFDTRITHSLSSSEYNRRRGECAEGVAAIHKRFPEVTHLRDVSPEMLADCRSSMDAVIFRRCHYVVGENERVLRACSALKLGDLKAFGELMIQTHEGLSREYEVSCPELDFLVQILKGNPHVYGSRLMGGGFGGCTINLIESHAVEPISAMVREQYRRRFQHDPKMYVTSISSGTSIVNANDHVRT
ncbi:MAG: galactokinase [Ignavibacteriales bacterium]|nr:galactokinase [Ignavibacteriales bacterium]